MRDVAMKNHEEVTPRKPSHQSKRKVSESMQDDRRESSLKGHGPHKSGQHLIKKIDHEMSSKKFDETLGSDQQLIISSKQPKPLFSKSRTSVDGKRITVGDISEEVPSAR